MMSAERTLEDARALMEEAMGIDIRLEYAYKIRKRSIEAHFYFLIDKKPLRFDYELEIDAQIYAEEIVDTFSRCLRDYADGKRGVDQY